MAHCRKVSALTVEPKETRNKSVHEWIERRERSHCSGGMEEDKVSRESGGGHSCGVLAPHWIPETVNPGDKDKA